MVRARGTLFLACCASAHASAVQPVAATSSSSRSSRLGRETSFWASATAGGAAAAAATITFHPLDTVKTVLQRGGAGGAAAERVRSLGAAGLYRGVLPAAFSMMPACAVRMGAYEVLKATLLQHAPPSVSPGALVFFASALSVVASSSVRAPLDMVKTRVQADASISAAAALRSAWAGGVTSIYRGAGLGLMRDVPFFGCNLLLYEQLKAQAIERKLSKVREQERRRLERQCALGGPCNEPDLAPPALAPVPGGARGVGGGSGSAALLSPLELVLIGAAAQGLAGWLTNPADVLKTRVQSGAAANVGVALQAALRDGGVGSLMRGAGLRVAWIAPQGCIYYPAYEAVQRLLSRGA